MTRRALSLRRRVTLGLTALGLLLSLLFASAAVYITEDYEFILVDEILRGQAEDYTRRMETDPSVALPQTRRLSGYLRRSDGTGDVPARFLPMPVGIHELESPSNGMHVGVFDTDHGRLYFAIDLGDIERLERHLSRFSLAIIVLGTALSGWLGWVLARAVIAPVTRLAADVDALPTQPAVSTLAATAGSDELGRLASAIDNYQQRLVNAEANERAFFADANHELRTPVAVVQGAVELLLEEPAADAGMLRRLHRLDRGVREMSELLDVMFGLVRRRAPQPSTLDAQELLRECLHPFLLATDPPRLQLVIDGDARWHTSQREALLVLRGVVRRMLPAQPAGHLALRVQSSALELDFHADGADRASDSALAPKQRSDQGLGLTLIARLATQLGWQIEEFSTAGSRRLVRIVLPATAARANA